LFANGLSIGSGIGGAEIYAWSVVVHDGNSTAMRWFVHSAIAWLRFRKKARRSRSQRSTLIGPGRRTSSRSAAQVRVLGCALHGYLCPFRPKYHMHSIATRRSGRIFGDAALGIVELSTEFLENVKVPAVSLIGVDDLSLTQPLGPALAQSKLRDAPELPLQ
jgi:hypothetical protein